MKKFHWRSIILADIIKLIQIFQIFEEKPYSMQPPLLSDNQVQIWHIPCLINQDVIKYLIADLRADEQEKATRYRFEKGRNVFVSARTALKWLLSVHTGLPVSHINLVTNDHGKPFLADAAQRELFFNVSHTGNHIVIALSKVDIGIDIETIKGRHNELARIVEQGHKIELENFSKIREEDKFNAFFSWWCRKESFVKGVGKGLGLSLKSFVASFEPVDQNHLLQVDDPNLAQWCIYNVNAPEGCAGAITYQGVKRQHTYHDFDWSNALLD